MSATALSGNILLSAVIALVSLAAGCKSNTEIFLEREELKLFAENAQRAYHAGQYERAAHQAKKAIEIDPDYTKARTILGYTYLMQVRYSEKRDVRLEYCEKAEQEFSAAIKSGSESDPSVFKAYFGMGLAYFMWAQEVKYMIAEAAGERAPVTIESGGEEPGDPGSGRKGEEVWSD